MPALVESQAPEEQFMRKIISSMFLSLDGVMQAPGGPKEDTSGGFKYGGWTFPYFDNFSRKIMDSQMKKSDLLLGRKTFKIFEAYWPKHSDGWPGINEVKKYVVSYKRAGKVKTGSFA